MQHATSRAQRGASLIEAMVALAVTALGLLTFVGLHLAVRANADFAKQRSEAVRIAQQDLENIRVFRVSTSATAAQGVLPIDTVVANFSDSNITQGVTTTNGTVTTVYSGNATYTLTRTVNTPAGADYTEVRVQVSWVDRQGQTQQVVLRNIIGRVDPGTSASLFVKPNGSPVRDTLGRNVQIPIPAKNFGDGTSGFKPSSNATKAIVFNNDTGMVEEVCDVASTLSTAQLTPGQVTTGTDGVRTRTGSNLSNCVSRSGYLISGFIRFKNTGFNSQFVADQANDPPPAGATWNPIIDFSGEPFPATQLGTLGMLTKTGWPALNRGNYVTPLCSSESLITISYTANISLSQQNNGTTTTTSVGRFYLPVPASEFPDSAFPSGNNAPSDDLKGKVAKYAGRTSSQILSVTNEGERYVAYTCVVYPIQLDTTSAGSTDTTLEWTGRLTFSVSGVDISIAANSNGRKICRFSQDYNRNGYIWIPNEVPSDNSTTPVTKIDNEEHPYAYLKVRRSLSNQNFLVIPGNENCPSDSPVEVDGQGGDNYTDATTVTHQP